MRAIAPAADRPPRAARERRETPPGAVARERDLRLFLLYRALSTAYLFAPVLLLFFAERGLSVTETTLLNSVYCGTLVLFEVPTGVLADRWGRKRAMVLGSLLAAAGCAVDWAGHSFAAFAVGDGLLALGMTLSSGADSAWLYDLLRDAGRAHEYRRREGRASAAKLVGAAVALVAGGWLGRRDLGATYLATAGVCLAAAAVAALLGERRASRPRVVGTSPDGARAVLAQMASSARAVVRRGPLRSAVLFSTLVFTLLRLGTYLHQPYLARAGLDRLAGGVVLAALSLAGALGAARIETLRRAVGERALVVGLPAALALAYLVLGGWFAGWGVGVLLVQGALGGVYSPLSKELLNREIADSGQRATVLSVESMARRLAFGAVAPLVGALVDARGLAAGLAGCAALGVVGTAALIVALARRDAARAREAVVVAPLSTPIALPVDEPALLLARASGGE